ncbi:PadR family transcriptional regulator [Desulfitobacterium sp. AusDCA]|uniref:PadR family transcriptional regulator n=1 Tax=Desulfitobacterium sp. AusDCA TaxID=3240383 RepID=UPI003DA7171E
MLTNIELILLNFIKIKSSYAYEIERMIEEKGIRKWLKIGGPTVYQVLDRLSKKGILQVSLEKEGNMPQRKRYTLTSEGEELCQKSARDLLANIEPYYFDLTVGLACRFFLSEEEFRLVIQERLKKLNRFISDFNDEFNKVRELYPDKRLLVRRYLLSHYKLEQKFLRDLLNDTLINP